MPKLDPPTAAAVVDHCHCIDFSLPLHRHSIQPIMFYFEVIKTCFLLSLISIYCSLSLYPLQLFMEFCQFVVVGCSGFKFFFFFHGILLVCGCGLRVALDLIFFFFIFVFFFFADFHVFFFLLCCQIYGKEESRNFFNYIFFSLFLYAIFIGFLVSWDSSIWF